MTMGLIMLLCGTVEYITSIGLEFFFGQRWWDYSDMLFNFQGRICLEGLLIFGIGGLFFIYLIAPKIDNLLQTAEGENVSVRGIILPLCCGPDSFLPVPEYGIRNHGVAVYLTSILPITSPMGAAIASSAPTSFAVALLLITTRCLPRK